MITSGLGKKSLMGITYGVASAEDCVVSSVMRSVNCFARSVQRSRCGYVYRVITDNHGMSKGYITRPDRARISFAAYRVALRALAYPNDRNARFDEYLSHAISMLLRYYKYAIAKYDTYDTSERNFLISATHVLNYTSYTANPSICATRFYI